MTEDKPKRESLEGVHHHSFSSLNAFVNICPLQYLYRYVERRAPERRAAVLAFGSAVNEALASIDRELSRGRGPDEAGAGEVFASYWKRQFAGDVPLEFTGSDTSESLLLKGERLVEHYARELLPEERPRPEDQLRFTVPIQDRDGQVLERPLVGAFDRLIDVDGRFGIVDWKTAAKRWTQDELDRDLQATAYLYAAPLAIGEAPAFFRYDLLLKTKKPGIERYYVDRTERDIRRFVRIVREVDNALDAGVFVPRDKSWACRSCSYRGACDEWQD